MPDVMLSIPVPEEDAEWLLEQVKAFLAERIRGRRIVQLMAANPDYVEGAVMMAMTSLTAKAVIAAPAKVVPI